MVSAEIVFIFHSACDEVKDESSLYVPVSKMDMKKTMANPLLPVSYFL